MSWGERSCRKFGKCNLDATITTCTTSCRDYLWDGHTAIDSPKPQLTKTQLRLMAKLKEQPND